MLSYMNHMNFMNHMKLFLWYRNSLSREKQGMSVQYKDLFAFLNVKGKR